MDRTKRQITKIAREVNRFTVRMLKEDGVGTAEFDFIHAVRKNPGITQARLRELLKLDKGAAARRSANLETKGYLVRIPNPEDGRSQLLYATEKAEELKISKAAVEAGFYEWVMEELSDRDQEELARLLNLVYERTKTESQADFSSVTEFVAERAAQGDGRDTADGAGKGKSSYGKD